MDVQSRLDPSFVQNPDSRSLIQPHICSLCFPPEAVRGPGEEECPRLTRGRLHARPLLYRLFLTPPRSDPRSWGAECNEPSAGFPAMHKAKILNIEEALAFIEVADKLSPSLSCRDSARAVKSQPTVARCSPFHCNYESRLFLMWREHPFTPRPHHSFSYFLSPSACLSLMFPR